MDLHTITTKKARKPNFEKSVFIKILFLTAVNRLLSSSYILWYETTGWERLACLII